MSKSREYMSHHLDNPPEWYWINGLHDAGIIGVEAFEFPFDYNKFVGEKSKYRRYLYYYQQRRYRMYYRTFRLWKKYLPSLLKLYGRPNWRSDYF